MQRKIISQGKTFNHSNPVARLLALLKERVGMKCLPGVANQPLGPELYGGPHKALGDEVRGSGRVEGHAYSSWLLAAFCCSQLTK